jgi:hypothetical protein
MTEDDLQIRKTVEHACHNQPYELNAGLIVPAQAKRREGQINQLPEP